MNVCRFGKREQDGVGGIAWRAATNFCWIYARETIYPCSSTLRIISHAFLEQEAREKRFREDLYYRQNVVLIKMPPLR